MALVYGHGGDDEVGAISRQWRSKWLEWDRIGQDISLLVTV